VPHRVDKKKKVSLKLVYVIMLVLGSRLEKKEAPISYCHKSQVVQKNLKNLKNMKSWTTAMVNEKKPLLSAGQKGHYQTFKVLTSIGN